MGNSQEGHCFEHLGNADVDLCVEAATSAGEEIWGIAFNTMRSPAIAHDPRCEVNSVIKRSGQPSLL